MGLDEIAAAAGTTTTPQRARGVATADRTEAPLVSRLAAVEEELPCKARAAATILRTHTAGTPIGESARAADLAPITAAKVLHRLGVDGVCPLAPTARTIVRDWLAGSLPRAEALELTGASDREFALAVYIETHDPVPEAAQLTADAEVGGRDAMVEKRERLADAVGGRAGSH
ncbi:MAG: hypothetical protein ABEJ35_03085 [Halobacteriaceae archaeon]